MKETTEDARNKLYNVVSEQQAAILALKARVQAAESTIKALRVQLRGTESTVTLLCNQVNILTLAVSHLCYWHKEFRFCSTRCRERLWKDNTEIQRLHSKKDKYKVQAELLEASAANLDTTL